MKRYLILGLVFISMIVLISSCGRVPPGYEGIQVNNWGSQRGVQDFTVKTGMFMYNPITQSIFKWPVFVQTAVWTKSPHEGSKNNEEITFNDKNGLVISADISLSYKIKAGKSPAFYVKFRTDDLDTFTHGYLRNVARDAFNEVSCTMSVEEIYGSKKEQMLADVKKRINDSIIEYAEIEQFGFIGAPRPPQAVIDSINAKIAATQMAIQRENEIRTSEAEAKKKVAQAQGEAQANLLLTKSLTPDLIKWRELELTKMAIDKWDGRRPMVEGSNGGLLLNLPSK